jgi:hypothetical protein
MVWEEHPVTDTPRCNPKRTALRPLRKESEMRKGHRFAVCCTGLLLALWAIPGLISAPHAADAKALLNQVNKELRQAQRDMFGGKTEKAVASLETIREKLLQAKEADPNSPQLKSCEGKYEKLVKDLERRTGKDLGGGSLTAAGASSGTGFAPKPEAKPLEKKTAGPSRKPDLPPKPEAKPLEKQAARETPRAAGADAKLPYNARRPMENARRDLQRVESSMERLGNPDWNQDQLVGNMKQSLESARTNLETGRAEAAKKGVTFHPDFDAVEAGIREAEQRIAEAGRSVEQAKQEAAAGAEEVTADVEALKAEYDRALPLLEKATGTAIYYNDLETAAALAEQIEQFEQNDLTRVQDRLQAFADKYGATEDEIDRAAEAMGYVNNYYRASYPYAELVKGIENVDRTRTVMADDLVRRAEEMKTRTAKGIHDFARLKEHARVKAWGQTAARFDPDNPRVKAFNDGVDAWAEADAKALYEKIDKATFPEQAADAPADAGKLAREAKAFLQKEEDRLAAEKGKEVSRVLAVVVTGPWRVFKKNLLGEPIQYNLPIATAVQTESEKSKNLVRVYLSTMLTQEMKGVKKAPPFLGATVGDSYYVRPSALK